MQIIKFKNINGEWQAGNGDRYILTEIQPGVAFATNKTVVNAASAEEYAASQGWEKVE